MSTPSFPRTPQEVVVTQEAIRTPRAAAAAGIVFAVLLIVALVLIRLAVPPNPHDAGTWMSDGPHRNGVLFALSLVPFAGIAFLWFIGVVRDRIGELEDRFFATVFLGSGLLFVAMLFVASAVAAGLVATEPQATHSAAVMATWSFGRQVTYTVATIYGMRMAAVFTISTSTILLRTKAVPRWIALSGYAVALVLLLASGLFAWFELLFPVWILVLSIYVLVESLRAAI